MDSKTTVPIVSKTYGTHNAVCNTADWEILQNYTWRLKAVGNSQFYAVTNVRMGPGRSNYKTVYMHTMIMGNGLGLDVDHKDGNKLNNSRDNLRFCTHAENMRNQKARKLGASGLPGVSLRKDTGKWRAFIVRDGRQTNIGCFETKEAAQSAYRQVAKAIHGDFGRVE